MGAGQPGLLIAAVSRANSTRPRMTEAVSATCRAPGVARASRAATASRTVGGIEGQPASRISLT